MRPSILTRLRTRRPSTLKGWLFGGLTVAAIVTLKLIAGAAVIAALWRLIH